MADEMRVNSLDVGESSASLDNAGSGIWLSVLIPAYEHPLGVTRILNRLHAARVAGVECLISDDSPSNVVEAAVLKHPLYRTGCVFYRRNTPAQGAVQNWNGLLARAQGDYLLLMHHDECPERDDFFDRLRSLLTKNGAPDVLLLECLLPALGGRRFRQHVPLWLRRLSMRLGPEHLLLHNTLGPPSVVVVRRSICPDFDPALKWLVDVEWMVRLLRRAGDRFVFAKRLAVVSLPHGASITTSLKGDIPRLREEESRGVRGRLGPALVFHLLLPESPAKRLLARMEGVLWLVVRALTRSTGWCFGRDQPAWLSEEA